MILTVFLALFVLLIIYLLLAPIVLYINTAEGQYYIRLKGLAKASIEGHKEELLRIKLKIFSRNFYFYPLKKIGAAKKKKSVKRNGRKTMRRIGIGRMLRMLRSFKVRRVLLDIDTGNCISNAKLYPFFVLLNYTSGEFRINFEGRNTMALHLENRPIHIIKSFINF